jgi:GcrA cell cycle regulator
MGKTTWTEEDVEFLKARWGAKEWSAAVIGNAIGKSRNAVIGKAGRLGLSTKPPVFKPAPIIREVIPENVEGIPLSDVESHHCRFMQVKGYVCGEQITRGSYCEKHFEEAHSENAPKTWTKQRLAELIAAYNEGMAPSDIAYRMNLKYTQIMYKVDYLRRKGILN